MGVSNSPIPPSLSIKFLIIGGGIAGFACAIALRRVGHAVVVFEQDDAFEGKSSKGIPLPPNLCKILYHWGLKEEIDSIGLKSQTIDLRIYETGELIGEQVWDDELLREAQGIFTFAHESDLRNVLYNAAISLGAQIRLGTHVKSVEPATCNVTLADGESVNGDVIIGADGSSGIVREKLNKNEISPSTRIDVHSIMVPKDLVFQNNELLTLNTWDTHAMRRWYGNGQCALGFAVGGTPEFALYIYHRRENDSSESTLDEAFQKGEPRLKKLYQLASTLSSTVLYEYSELEHWVHEGGSMVIVGEAAHPMLPGSIQKHALNVEDAAVLAKLFSRLRTRDQVRYFLGAFEDLRQPRCNQIVKTEIEHIHFMSLPLIRVDDQISPDPDAKYVSDGMGKQEIEDVFGYDAEDDADNWWIRWGLLHERANGVAVESKLVSNIKITQER